MWTELLSALALLLVLEGILPFLNPTGMRKTMRMLSEMDDKTLRVTGFFTMIAGAILLYIVRT
ncbi:MAG: DUF2065 domain-containing protein [Gammaproteobacteria bacterium]|nr:DUF2065 domain-containing protein [Gammaproteobacteria bacterium]MDH5594336.1 DUF2065 domain-containing protein [Gammaproteobacteria bacterium]MDH5614801.1 DUF2065 domain-containing protein [Gammaproteobacteria bacterium]